MITLNMHQLYLGWTYWGFNELEVGLSYNAINSGANILNDFAPIFFCGKYPFQNSYTLCFIL